MLLQEHHAAAVEAERRRAAGRRASAAVTAQAKRAHAVVLERVRASVLLLPDPVADQPRSA